MDQDDLHNRFSYHRPVDQEQIDKYQAIRLDARGLATRINEYCPEGREKALAITKLEETVMWANAAIARHHD